MRFFFLSLCLLTAITLHTAHASGQPSQSSQTHARTIAHACPQAWDTNTCKSALSETVLTLAGAYAETLNNAGHSADLEPLKQGCAAATAASKIEVPGQALASAMTECANIISDITQRTNTPPDKSLYQLLVFPLLCLKNEPSCPAFEGQLQAYK